MQTPTLNLVLSTSRLPSAQILPRGAPGAVCQQGVPGQGNEGLGFPNYALL